MISLTPNSTPAETSALFALLAVIADPTAAKARLDELVAEKLAALDAVAEADGKLKAAEAAEAAGNDARDKAALQHESGLVDIAEKTTELDARARKIALREAATSDMLATIGAKEVDLTKQEADLTERAAAIVAREEEVVARETMAETLEAEAQALKTEYETKIAALKAAVGE